MNKSPRTAGLVAAIFLVLAAGFVYRLHHASQVRAEVDRNGMLTQASVSSSDSQDSALDFFRDEASCGGRANPYLVHFTDQHGVAQVNRVVLCGRSNNYVRGTVEVKYDALNPAKLYLPNQHGFRPPLAVWLVLIVLIGTAPLTVRLRKRATSV